MKMIKIFKNIRLGKYSEDEFAREVNEPAADVRTGCRWFCGANDMIVAYRVF